RLEPLGHAGAVRRLTPRPPSDHLVLSVLRPLRVAIGSLGVILVVIGVMDPFCDVAGHIIQAIRASSSLEFPRRGQVLVAVLRSFQVGVVPRPRSAPRTLATTFPLGRFPPRTLRRNTLARP